MRPLIVAGGGIAGIALALSCRQAGIPVLVLEQAPEIRALGVGINLQPHAVRELLDLGLGPALGRAGVEPRALAYFSRRGRPIWEEARGRAAGYRWPQYSIHRGALLALLAGALAEAAPGTLRTDARVTGFDDGPDGVRVRFLHEGREETAEGALLVACDGIHSRIRAALNPGEGPPRWGGAVLWRGTTRAAPFLGGATIAYFGHEWQKFVTYPISGPDAGGRVLVNWIAERKFDPSAGWNREDWSRPGRFEDFLPWFADWRFEALDIPALVEGAEAVWEYPMVDRDPLPSWSRGRVTLMGDAAHPMYPIGSNGASQAILDARTLVRAILDHGTTPAALLAYEAERRPPTARIVLANRGNGPDEVLEIVERRCGGEFRDIADIIPDAERAEMAERYKAIAGMDVAGLNARPAILEGLVRPN